ncbi:MAG: ATPase [Chloroflexi bacterium]|nr:ATPase [Chloroflexota bacterium]MBL7199046.1 ATPase [Anaerolineae bacterium]
MQRVKTGIVGLDEMLHGGFLPQTANLVEGAPGTGKTTLGMQFIYNGITKYDEPGLILTFEEFPQQYYRDAGSFGWDFRSLEREGKLKIIMTSPEISKLDFEDVGGLIETTAQQIGSRRILVDSLSHFQRISRDPIELRSLQYSFINALKRVGLTSILTKESDVILGEMTSEEDAAFIADSFTMLRYVEIESAIHKALLVLKLRGSDHAKDIRQFQVGPHGIEVQARFEGQEGIMSGSPHRTMAESFVEAFVRK